MREKGLHGRIETLRIDFMHELIAFKRCFQDGGPEYGAGVVD